MSHDETTSVQPTRHRDPGQHELGDLILIGATPVGRGIFARRKLSPGLVLGEIHGEILDDHPEDSSYVMELPSSRLLEPAPPFRFVNHSCDPNCELFYWYDEDSEAQEDRLWVQTIRPIKQGEELSIDYCWPADAAIPCRCGTESCRGWIVDPAERHLLPDPETAVPTSPNPALSTAVMAPNAATTQ
ncbi:SET domain-containing protein-lysine N-methyltransferase [bacterium]|nr:SET domain-containing protein-lysine N-methyltransferase [bacterium]